VLEEECGVSFGEELTWQTFTSYVAGEYLDGFINLSLSHESEWVSFDRISVDDWTCVEGAWNP